MYKGMYIALSGALLKQKHMDIFAQNMANANTSGFKKERISFQDFIIPVDNNPGMVEDVRVMSTLSTVLTDFSPGNHVKTGNPLDAAINGEGFFALEDNKYTRNGSFQVSSEGYLVTHDGIKVLGSGGPIAIEGSKVDINSSGEVFVDDISVGTLKIVDFDDKGVLSKLTGGIFHTEEAADEVDAKVNQGFIEGSNVEVLREMVKMINALREFEAYQKMIRTFDEAASKTTNELTR
jgi:flagellar basal-body rod protein FlgF